MAYTTPRTWVVGEVLTAALLNVQLRDNLNYLFSLAGEVAYAQITATVSLGPGGATIVTAPAFTADGVTPALVEFWAPKVIATAGGVTTINLVRDGSSVGKLAEWGAVASTYGAVKLERKETPAAGSRTYAIQGVGNTSTLVAGAGGAGVDMPAFIRISRGG